jgi:hypothetical protein
MSVKDLLLLVVRQPCCQLARVIERVLDAGELVDEAGARLEQLGELVDAQLPR